MRGNNNMGVRLLECVAVIIAIYVLIALAQPNINVTRDSHRIAEAKDNLHLIQLCVERYAVDYDGQYPAYLCGGNGHWSAAVDLHRPGFAFTGQAYVLDRAQLTDPLLSLGYLDEYPRNPFVRSGLRVHQLQLALPLNAPGGDPLRNACATGREYGTRFGEYCTTMGQVLGAREYLFSAQLQPGGQFTVTGMTPVSMAGQPPGADVLYPCWDVWPSRKGSNPYSGQFVYAASGPIVALGQPSPTGQCTILPVERDNYVLGVYGGPRTFGQDMMDSYGNPFQAAQPYASNQQAHAAQTAIADGIVLVLTAGCD